MNGLIAHLDEGQRDRWERAFGAVYLDTQDTALATVAAWRQAVGGDEVKHEVVGVPRTVECAASEGEWLPVYVESEVLHSGHPDGKYTVDRAFMEQMLEAFEHFAGEYDYYPPILPQHDKGEQDGTVYGLIKDLRIQGDTLEGYHEYAEGVPELIEQGRLVYRSPTHALELTDPHTGETFENALVEVSYVRKPQLRNIGVSEAAADHYVLNEHGFIEQDDDSQPPSQSEDTMPDGNESEEAVENQTEEMLAEIVERLDTLDERIAALEGEAENEEQGEGETENADEADEGDEDEDDDVVDTEAGGESVENAQIAELQKRIVDLEKENDRAKREKRIADIRARLGDEVEHEVIEAYAQLPDDKLDKVLEHAATAQTEGGVVEHGEVGTGAKGETVTLEHAREVADDEIGVTHGQEFVDFCRKRFPALAKEHY